MPEKRADTAELLQLDKIVLARMQSEVAIEHKENALREEKLRRLDIALTSREEKLAIQEANFAARQEEVMRILDEKNQALRVEIDRELREYWEVRAEATIKQQVEMRTKHEIATKLDGELAARIEIEVERRIREMNLVPANSNGASTSSNSSGASSSVSGFCAPNSPPRLGFHSQHVLVPDSPGDITMSSPQPYQPTPARPNSMHHIYQMPAPKLNLHQNKIEQDLAARGPTRLSFPGAAPGGRADDSFDDMMVSPVKQKTSYPSQESPLARRQGGFRRANTTTNVFRGGLNPMSDEQKDGFLNMKKAAAMNSLKTGMSIIELAKIRDEEARRQRSSSSENIDPPAQWDHEVEGDNMPSPFKKREERRRL